MNGEGPWKETPPLAPLHSQRYILVQPSKPFIPPDHRVLVVAVFKPVGCSCAPSSLSVLSLQSVRPSLSAVCTFEGAAAAVSLRSKVTCLASSYGNSGSGIAPASWILGALALPALAYMLQDQEVYAAENLGIYSHQPPCLLI
ncbi:hypothetical protein PIB30_030907 [Stylosanthes scabra]|uniref:Uncharacterized protein n=1 Tax=Stylosanthes scabra TaxID=79078 RepID=A0ABU6Y8Y7_9FABA|nr:hypothetical protein [Stylosanthes scabra]